MLLDEGEGGGGGGGGRGELQYLSCSVMKVWIR